VDRRTLLTLPWALAGASLPLARTVQARPQAYGSQALIRLADNRPGIMTHVNGQGPFLFLIDTATSHTVVVPELRERLALPAVAGPTYDVVTAAGSVRSSFYQLREIACSGVIVEGGKVVVIDLPRQFGISGVLGADFLQNFTADLDLGTHKLTLYPEGTVVQNRGLQRVRGQLSPHGFIVAPAIVDGVRVNAIFDSGAALTVANPPLAAYNHRTVKIIARVIESKVVDAAHQRGWAESIGFARITLGPVSWRQRQVMIADMRVFAQIGLDRTPAIFIGMDLMMGRRVVLDYAGAALWLAPADEPDVRT
jgi:predicted aspartyl protease